MWRRKNKGKKRKNKCDTCVKDKKREKKGKKRKEMVSQYFHNTFIINLKW